MIKKYLALSVIAATLAITGCSSDDNTPAEVVFVATPGVGGTAFDTIANSDDHNTLQAAIEAAGLDDVLDNPANVYTIFAPNDAAFTALDGDNDDATLTTAELLLPENLATLQRVLQFHVISGDVASQTVVDLIAAAAGGDPVVQNTLVVDEGTALTLTFTESTTSNEGLAVEGVDVTAANQVPTDGTTAVGRVHFIGEVLLPAAAPVVVDPPVEPPVEPPVTSGATDTLIASSGNFEIFRSRLNIDFPGSLDTNAWTAFIPSDTILGTAGVTELTAEQVRDHIVSAGARSPADLAGLATILAASNAAYAVETTGGVTTVGGFVVELLGTGASGAQIYSVAGVLAP